MNRFLMKKPAGVTASPVAWLRLAGAGGVSENRASPEIRRVQIVRRQNVQARCAGLIQG